MRAFYPTTVLITGLLIVFSNYGQAAVEDSLSEICQQIVKEQATLHPPKHASVKLLLTYLFQRNTFVRPMEIFQLTELGESSQLTPANFPGDEAALAIQDQDLNAINPDLGQIPVTVFTLGHVETVTPEDHQSLEQLTQALKTQANFIQKLASSSNVNACISRAIELGWSSNQIDSLTALQESALPAQRRLESGLSYNAAKIAIKRHPTWRIVPIDSWSEILQSVWNTSPRGILVMAHADSNGRLYDSERNELPSRFFDAVPVSVPYIGIYSCNSDAVSKAYGLEKLALRHRINVVDLAPPFNMSESAPVQLFPTWVGKILKQHRNPLYLADVTQPKRCSLELRGLHLDQGRVSVELEGLPVAVWAGEDREKISSFPCQWLTTSTSPTVFLQPSSSKQSLSLTKNSISAVIAVDNLPKFILHNYHIFLKADGNFRSATIRE